VVVEGTPGGLKAELRGDAIHAELAEPDLGGHAHMALGRVAGVREVAVEGRQLRAARRDGASAVPAVLAALDAEGLGVTSITVARPVARRRATCGIRAGRSAGATDPSPALHAQEDR
jgi:ABC-2 type transport system ATP-binding protein